MTATIIAMDILTSQNYEINNVMYTISLAQYREDNSRFVFFVTNQESGKNNKYELGANNCGFNGTQTFEELPKDIQEDIRAGRP